MQRDAYINQIEERLIARGFDDQSPNELFNYDLETTFLGFTLSEDKQKKRLLSNFVAYFKHEIRSAPQDNIAQSVAIYKPESNSPEVREDPEKSPAALIRNVSSGISNYISSQGVESKTKIFIHILFVTNHATKTMKIAVKNHKDLSYPSYGVLPVLADLENGTLTYNTENQGHKGLVGTPYTEQLNERAEKYFTVSE